MNQKAEAVREEQTKEGGEGEGVVKYRQREIVCLSNEKKKKRETLYGIMPKTCMELNTKALL